jgi:DNA repair exonuclease SbcCD ATPase subunit
MSMAPVQVAGVTTAPPTRKAAQWTRESVITEIQHFVQAHGEVPRLADLNPGQAKITGQVWRIDRYRAGCPVCGSPYPSANAARRCFDGSLEAAIRAAGFEPAKRGPRRRAEVDLSARALERLDRDARVAIDAALARAAAAEQRAGRLELQLERAHARAEAAPKVRTKVVRERVGDPAALVRVQRRLEAAEARSSALKSELGEARMDAAEARRTAARLAARLERAEATVTDARAAKREVQGQLADAQRAAERAADRAAAAERRAGDRRPSLPLQRVVAAAPEQTIVDEALARAAAAQDAARRAERRAADAERDYAELAAAATGAPRKLTTAELDGLRSDGPAGPALLAEALKALAGARRAGDRLRLEEALGHVAAAAVTWRDRV